ncbi:MAG: hypothetical protein OJF52_000288 [Nitrospira sp.]|nr:MAG: hypothetical protein OJF52_000288 [Nitrospira sp.]
MPKKQWPDVQDRSDLCRLRRYCAGGKQAGRMKNGKIRSNMVTAQGDSLSL